MPEPSLTLQAQEGKAQRRPAKPARAACRPHT